jgi:hypothetical protein
MKIRTQFAMLTLPIVAACGGGGHDGPCQQFNGTAWVACTPAAPPPSTAIPEGIWGGGTSTGLAVSTLVLENGQYFIVPTSTSGVGLVEGIMTASAGNFTDPAAVVYPSSDVPVAATTTGSFTAKKSLSGTVAASQSLSSPFPQGTTGVTFNGDYNSLYDSPATIAEALGTWTGQTAGSSASVSLSVAADGTFTGTNGSCSFSGSVTPRSTGKHVLDGKVTFNSNSCLLSAGTSMGFEAVVSGNQFVAAGVTTQRDHAFVVVATKG